VPHHVMYSFKGTLHLDSESQAIPLDNQQLLLQVYLIFINFLYNNIFFSSVLFNST
jgi:hypothetical protein